MKSWNPSENLNVCPISEPPNYQLYYVQQRYNKDEIRTRGYKYTLIYETYILFLKCLSQNV